MLKIVNEVRKTDSARIVFTIFYDRSYKRTLYQPTELGRANLPNTLIVLYYGHENAPILKNKLEYEDLRERNGLNCQWATHNTPLISRIIGVNLKRI
jgi:hypothetical protein